MQIAVVHANWAAVDHGLGMIIAAQSDITAPAHVGELVHALDVKKKIDLIAARKRRGEIPARAHKLVKELVFIGANYRSDRNMLAHGMIIGEGDATVFWSGSKLRALPVSELAAIADEAQYAAHVVFHLHMALVGVTMPQTLPPRPPVRSPAL